MRSNVLKWPLAIAVALGAAVVAVPLAQEGAVPVERSMPDTFNLNRMAARFVPTDIGADLSALSATDRQVLAKLVEASKIMDALFLRQSWDGNEAMLLDLVR